VVSDVNLSGTVAQYGRGSSMIEALSQQLLKQFSKNLTAQIEASSAPAEVDASMSSQPTGTGADTAATDAQPAPPVQPRRASAPVAPLDAGSLVRQALWQSIRNFFARLFGARQSR